MDVKLAKTAGFCFGVKRAVDRVYEAIDSGRQIYTLGPIIHNNEVVKDLESRGVITLKDESELDKVSEGGVLIVRSHGVSKNIIDMIEERHIEYIDMTCPFVKRIHDIVAKASETDDIVIIGNPSHPEVIGIKGWSKRTVSVIESPEEALNFTQKEGLETTVVSQTTYNHNKFKEIIAIFDKKGYNVNVVNTICDATRRRQEEAGAIAGDVSVMIVIGDKQSSNSKKLFDICNAKCDNTYFIQTLSELDANSLDKLVKKEKMTGSVGITAGASTPQNIIEEVQNYVRINF